MYVWRAVVVGTGMPLGDRASNARGAVIMKWPPIGAAALEFVTSVSPLFDTVFVYLLCFVDFVDLLLFVYSCIRVYS